ncbi:hypothetical protein F4860DRAFT_474812 [Xylaria cubensis]|nr:hypothetical protein F4860DRAFT_474812 [Xylaria cubensis]
MIISFLCDGDRHLLQIEATCTQHLRYPRTICILLITMGRMSQTKKNQDAQGSTEVELSSAQQSPWSKASSLPIDSCTQLKVDKQTDVGDVKSTPISAVNTCCVRGCNMDRTQPAERCRYHQVRLEFKRLERRKNRTDEQNAEPYTGSMCWVKGCRAARTQLSRCRYHSLSLEFYRFREERRRNRRKIAAALAQSNRDDRTIDIPETKSKQVV